MNPRLIALAFLCTIGLTGLEAQVITDPLLLLTFSNAGNTAGALTNYGTGSATFTSANATGSTFSYATGPVPNATYGSATNRYGQYTGGTSNTASSISSAAAYTELSGLTSFTLSGWWKVGLGNAGGRLMDTRTNTFTAGIDLFFDTSSTLRLQIDGIAASAASTAGTLSSAEWRFFAVTYDSATSTVNYYSGNTPGAITAFGTATLNAGAVDTVTSKLYIDGSGSTLNRSNNGFFDNLRIDGTALSLSDINTISAVPEPSSVALMLGGLGSVLVAARRRAMRG